MRDRSKILIIIAAVILCAAMLSACGAAPQNEATAAEPAAVPSSTVEPTPEPEPELPAGCAVTVDGMGLSGSVVSDGVTYVSAAEFFGALDLEYSADGGALNFVWRKAEMSVGGDGMQLLTYRGETYVPVNELCGEMGISLLVDDEYDHLYCTPAAGDWILPEGYSVPVLMYHYVTDDVAPLGTQKALAVSPETMEEYLKYLVDNGYDPIWFEDLEHVDEYDKPVILTFDDGHEDNYSELFPLLKKYNVKATFFVVTDYMNYATDVCMSREQVAELAQSGLVSIQSHTVTHPRLDMSTAESQEEEMRQSKLDLTRVTGKEPFVLSYPYGKCSIDTRPLMGEYYRFGVKMSGRVYVTGDDPVLVYRYYVQRGLGVEAFAQMASGKG